MDCIYIEYRYAVEARIPIAHSSSSGEQPMIATQQPTKDYREQYEIALIISRARPWNFSI
jgi:hypothetical protein